MTQYFFSGHAINDEVGFRPMYRQQQEMGIADEPMEGKIVAVRFTEAKVFYDVYNNYWGKVFEGVSSEKVYALPESPMLTPVEAEGQEG